MASCDWFHGTELARVPRHTLYECSYVIGTQVSVYEYEYEAAGGRRLLSVVRVSRRVSIDCGRAFSAPLRRSIRLL